MKPPRHVEVTGVLQDSSGLLVVAPASVEHVQVRDRDRPVRPAWVRTGSVGESTEGSLVRAVAVVTQGPVDDLPFGHKLLIDDGSGETTVYVNRDTHVHVQPFAVGQLVEVTGFSSQFNDHYEIDIRGPQDLAHTPCCSRLPSASPSRARDGKTGREVSRPRRSAAPPWGSEHAWGGGPPGRWVQASAAPPTLPPSECSAAESNARHVGSLTYTCAS